MKSNQISNKVTAFNNRRLLFSNSQESNLVWMMGPLHIEMAFINAIGDWLDWLDGSGWCEVFNKADISTPGEN